MHFEACDEIWHAGDFGNEEVLNKLSSFKPMRGVYGNIDGAPIRLSVPEVQDFQIEEFKVYMIHIGGYPGRYVPAVKKSLLNIRPQLFISGHSHILKVQYDPDLKCLHINPGAAGKEGWHKVRTLVRFSIDGADIKECEVIELGKR
jgi:putative phosphoesterase